MSMPSSSSRQSLPSISPDWVVPLSSVTFTDREVQAAESVLRSGWWTYGPVARQLEAEFAETHKVRHAIAVSNGTAALQLAFSALGLCEGDEVITPSLNFVAAANSILHCGGLPCFADVESLDQPLVSVETLERHITSRTRGLCLLHYAGQPCQMDSIMDLARRNGLWVVEDAAHAPGASWRNIPCGAWGDVGCFSFFGNKNLTCGEGGMITTQSDELAEKMKTLRSHGMSSLTWDRYLGHRHTYDVTEGGYNFRIDDLRAAILRIQLVSLERFNRLRGERVEWYRELLSEDDRWSIPLSRCEGESAHHLFVLVLSESIARDRIVRSLASRGIQSSIHYPPVHEFSFYRRILPPPSHLGVTEAIGRRILTLPLYPELTRDQVETVCSSLNEAAEH